MRFKSNCIRVSLMAALAVGIGMAGIAGPAQAPRAAEQIIFSGAGTSTLGPFGFWIWSEDEDAANPYHGNAMGAIYLYQLGLTKFVDGSVTEVGAGQYMISVASNDGTIVASLINTPPVTRGPKNTVDVLFTVP